MADIRICHFIDKICHFQELKAIAARDVNTGRCE
jgi:hypothetical protein